MSKAKVVILVWFQQQNRESKQSDQQSYGKYKLEINQESAQVRFLKLRW